MPISFSSAVGNLFNRLGKLGLLVKQARSYQSSQKTNLVDLANGVVAQYNSEPDVQAAIGDSYMGLLDSAGNTGAFAQQMARLTLNRMVFNDNPRIAQTLQNLNLLDSVSEVIRQMRIAGASVLAMSIAATPTAFTGTGNGAVVASVKRPFDGLVLENSFAETILVTCNGDSYVGGGLLNNEGLIATGTGSQGNPFAFNWPLGSDSSATLNAIDALTSNGSGNLLTDSGFETYATTANVPDNWLLENGTAGTHIAQETSLTYDPPPNSAVRLIGDGATQTRLTQQFNASTGTPGTLDPLTQYGFNIYARRDGTAANAGVLTVDLADAGGTVIKDANGVNNSFTIDLTQLSTNYAAFNGAFRTPRILPQAQYLRLRQTTPLQNGRSVYLDHASLGIMTQIYAGGPFLSVHGGSAPFVNSDYATVAVTNSRGAGGTLNTFQTLLFLLLPEAASAEVLWPSSATPTISDAALIA